MDPNPYLLRTGFYIYSIKHFLSVLKISKTLVFFFRTSGDYSKKYGHGSVFTTDPWLYLVICLFDFLEKNTIVLDIFNTDKEKEKNKNQVFRRYSSPSLHRTDIKN